MAITIEYDPSLSQQQQASLRRFEAYIRLMEKEGTFLWQPVSRPQGGDFLELYQELDVAPHLLRGTIPVAELLVFTGEKLMDQLQITRSPRST